MREGRGKEEGRKGGREEGEEWPTMDKHGYYLDTDSLSESLAFLTCPNRPMIRTAGEGSVILTMGASLLPNACSALER
eukprot:2113955-Heterocapsa_arctica.AAC.1